MEELRNRIDLSQHSFSLLGRDDFFKGEIVLKNDTFVSSRFEGSIHMEGESRLVIEPSASISGKINAHTVDLYGNVDGEIDVSGIIILYPSSRVKGRIKAQSIHIQPGAIIDGDCHTLQ